MMEALVATETLLRNIHSLGKSWLPSAQLICRLQEAITKAKEERDR